MEFHLDNNYIYKWDSQSYLFNDPKYKDDNLFCFAFEAISLNRIYLGGTWMKQHEILFDR